MPMTSEEISLTFMQSVRKIEEDKGMRPGELLEAMVYAFNERFGPATVETESADAVEAWDRRVREHGIGEVTETPLLRHLMRQRASKD